MEYARTKFKLIFAVLGIVPSCPENIPRTGGATICQ